MPINWSNYTLEQLRSHATTSFREAGGSRPDVLLIEIEGEQAVLKDQSKADKWFALLIGPILNWRETKALKRLAYIDCVPDLLGIPSKRSFLMSYHPSEQISHLKEIQPHWPDFFDKLSIAIDSLHQAGVAHNDLRNPSNTLITPEGEPILVDLVACFCKGSAWNIPNHWIFNKFTQVDLSAITKLKSRLAPELLNDHDVHAEQIAGNTGLAIKGLGQWVRKVSKKLFTKQTD